MGGMDNYYNNYNPRRLSQKHAVPLLIKPEPPTIDQRPSCLPIGFKDEGKDLIWTMPILGLGDLILRAESQRETGKLNFVGIRMETECRL